jgi:hypothetical protein
MHGATIKVNQIVDDDDDDSYCDNAVGIKTTSNIFCPSGEFYIW